MRDDVVRPGATCYFLSMSGEGGHPVAQVFLDRQGIVRVVHPEGAAVDLEEIARIQRAHSELAGSKRVPVLVDGNHGQRVSALEPSRNRSYRYPTSSGGHEVFDEGVHFLAKLYTAEQLLNAVRRSIGDP